MARFSFLQSSVSESIKLCFFKYVKEQSVTLWSAVTYCCAPTRHWDGLERIEIGYTYGFISKDLFYFPVGMIKRFRKWAVIGETVHVRVLPW